jgi:hypothetical protein
MKKSYKIKWTKNIQVCQERTQGGLERWEKRGKNEEDECIDQEEGKYKRVCYVLI